LLLAYCQIDWPIITDYSSSFSDHATSHDYSFDVIAAAAAAVAMELICVAI